MDFLGIFVIAIMIISIVATNIQRKLFKQDADLVTATVEKSGLAKTDNGFQSECIVSYWYNNKEYRVDIKVDNYKVGSKVELYIGRKHPDKFILKKQSYLGTYIVIALMLLYIYVGVALKISHQILAFALTFALAGILMTVYAIKYKEEHTFRVLAICCLIAVIVSLMFYNVKKDTDEKAFSFVNSIQEEGDD